MVSRYPHEIKIIVDNGAMVDGIYSPGTPDEYQTECNIQSKASSYKGGITEDSLNKHWKIFCPLFTGRDLTGIGDKIESITAPKGFILESDHKIISFKIFQKHIEIGV